MDTDGKRLRLLYPDIHGLERGKYLFGDWGATGMAEFARADRHFHRAIVHAAGNAILTRLYDALRDRQQRIATVSLARNPGDAERFVTEHRGIVEALGRGDAADAAHLVSAHLRAARDVARGARDA